MISATKIVLLLAVVATFASTAYAVKCYQCESLTNHKCGEEFSSDDTLTFDCSRANPPRYLQNFFPIRNATGCMKKTLESVGGHPQIIRSCYFGDVSNTQTGCQSDPSLPFVKQLSCEVCTSDLCNGSSATGPIAFAIILFVAIARIMS